MTTGRTVSSKPHGDCCISVEVQHISRDEKSELVVAVNTDSDRSIGKMVDVLVETERKQFVPMLIEKTLAVEPCGGSNTGPAQTSL